MRIKQTVGISPEGSQPRTEESRTDPVKDILRREETHLPTWHIVVAEKPRVVTRCLVWRPTVGRTRKIMVRPFGCRCCFVVVVAVVVVVVFVAVFADNSLACPLI